MQTMKTFAIDFESFYSDDISIKTLGTYNYIRQTDVYMVSIVGPDLEWVGHPKDAPWMQLSGQRIVAHNAGFDVAIANHLCETGVIPPEFEIGDWACTADMSVFHGLPRDLKGAIHMASRGTIEVSKDTRRAMLGKHWHEMSPEFQKEVSDYALHDSRLCLWLYNLLSPTFPAREKLISQHTAMMSWNGVPVNIELMNKAIVSLKQQADDALAQIPWSPPLSKKHLALACEKQGIPCPESLAQDSEECAEWEDKYGDDYVWVSAMRTFRRTNAFLKKVETMKAFTADGRLRVGLKYFGGHTGRDAGSIVNLQNLPRGPMFGVDIRRMIEAPEGRTLVISDLGQIEPRCTSLAAGDNVALDAMRSGQSPYEAHARASMGFTGGKLKFENPTMYSLAKARVLSMSYSVGFEKFLVMAKNYIDDTTYNSLFFAQPPISTVVEFEEYLDFLASKSQKLEDTQLFRYRQLPKETQWAWANSWRQVRDYRESNPKVTALWKKFDEGLRANAGGCYRVPLWSGRVMKYDQVSLKGGSLTYVGVRNGVPCRQRIYGGMVLENVIQANARDIFMHHVGQILRAGHDIILRVHDEVVVECDESDADATLADVQRIMRTPPPWCPDIPLDAEASVTKFYLK